MVLPEGTAVPPLAHGLVALLASAFVGAGLWRWRPPVSQWTVVALVPWMALGGGLHVLWVLGIGPDWARPLLGAPTVYLSTAVIAGAVWIAATLGASDPRPIDATLGSSGATGVTAVAVLIGWEVHRGPGVDLTWVALALLGTIVLSWAGWLALRSRTPDTTRVTGVAGVVVLFGHALDGVTTAIGIDVFGTGERSPIPRLITEAAAALPTAEFIGAGWAFVLVKLAVAIVVIWLFREYVAEAPAQGFLLLALLAAVGLGPGVHNLLLFLAAG